jgi:hypothetical protein
MFAPKKTIPKLVIGMLALTGCSDAAPGMPGGSGGTAGSGGTGGIGGTAGNDLANATEAWCMKIGTCYGGAVQGCIDVYVGYASGTSDECQAALISYFECIGEQPGCVDFSACDDYGDAFDGACFE